MADAFNATHKLFHEAQRRAKLPQQLIKHTKPNSVLLSAPNNIIFELFNVIVREVSDDKLLKYVINNLKDYLSSSWSTKITQQVIKRLQREQAVDVRAGVLRATDSKILSKDGSVKIDQTSQAKKDAARLKTSATKTDTIDKDLQKRIERIYEHVIWRIRSENVTQITSLLIKLVLDDGYKKGKLKAEIYEEIVPCFKDWRSNKLIKLYAFGDAPANDQKLILASTTAGDITKWVANYIDGSEKRQDPDLIRKLATALRDKTKNCVFITNNVEDAMQSLSTGAMRMVFVVDRLERYDTKLNSLTKLANFPSLRSSIVEGKLYIMNSLDCIEFAADPSSDACC